MINRLLKQSLTSDSFIKKWSLFYILIVICSFFSRLYLCYLNHEGGLSDCFINYEGGFVRRGLLGELLYHLYCINFDPISALLVLVFISALIVALFLIHKSKELNINFVFLLYCSLLGSLGVYPLRRDIILIFLFLCIIYTYKVLRFKYWIVFGNIISIIAILCYEPFLFFSLPIFVLLSKTKSTSYVKSFILWIPSIITFFTCCIYKGTPEACDAIIESVSPFWNDFNLINFIGKNTNEVFLFHLTTNFCGFNYGIPNVIVSTFSILCAIYYCIYAVPVYNPQARWNKINVCALILLLLLTMSPMFIVLSTDYGRMFGFISLCVYITVLTLDSETLHTMIPDIISKPSQKILSITEKYVNPTKFKILLIMLFVGLATWSGNNVDGNFYTSEFGFVIRNVKYIISKFAIL